MLSRYCAWDWPAVAQNGWPTDNILVLFLECISFVVVSAFPLLTLRRSHATARRTIRTRRGRTPAGGLSDSGRPSSPHASTSTTCICMCPNKNRQQPSHLDADSRKHPLTANMLSRLTPAQLLRLYLLLKRLHVTSRGRGFP